MKKDNKQKVIVFDTTLRDGQQCPWAWMSFEHNIEFAKIAEKLWIDILEAGFPSASKIDFDIVNTIAPIHKADWRIKVRLLDWGRTKFHTTHIQNKSVKI